ncbi:MAG: acetyl-CoA carboxylase biotin carboxylase subunit [Chloroflexi bacterium]|nr:acetyl-CoA carboxylase biotin carboxylase subunit [Chloroflexota bacterium]
MLRKVLVANRSEIAIRVMRACRELGIGTVAVYSEADRQAAHLFYADEAYLIGPAAPTLSYLNIDRIIQTALDCGADGIHPGYGFLAENAGFARQCEAAGLKFVGPPASAIEAMGDKIVSRQTMSAAGLPVVPGTLEPVQSVMEARSVADNLGYPVAIKAVAGGGGKGLRIAREGSEVEPAFEGAAREASGYFGNASLYIEKYLSNPRHIEMQILADGAGNAVYLGERDCSIQRRHQKLIEESPSPAISPEVRRRMGEAAVRAANASGYSSAGTLEFLLSADGEFYFLEMNTRIQVEHTVTEMVTGVDLVKEQLRLAGGAQLSLRQEDIMPQGHAIECRINAEDPSNGFRPTPGTIAYYSEPGGFGVRVDSGAYPGYTIPEHYDSLIAKLVVWGTDRAECRQRTLRALDEFQIEGVKTTIPFCRQVIAHPVFAAGNATTQFVENDLDSSLFPETRSPIGRFPVAPAAGDTRVRDIQVEINDKLYTVRVTAPELAEGPDGRRKPVQKRMVRGKYPADSEAVVSPMQGTVISVLVEAGQAVVSGDVVCVLEAMKMENEILAHRSGVVSQLVVKAGQTVENGALIALISA